MARKTTTMMPMPSMGASGGTGRKVVAMLVFVVVIALVIKDPAGAAVVAQRIGTLIGSALDGLGSFATALAQ
jgi:hypothetical protein